MGSFSRPREERPELAEGPTGLRALAHMCAGHGAGSPRAQSRGSRVLTGLPSAASAARLGASAETVCPARSGKARTAF